MNKRRRYQQKRNAKLYRMLAEKFNDHIDRMTDKEIRMWLRRPKKYHSRKHQEFRKAVRETRRTSEPWFRNDSLGGQRVTMPVILAPRRYSPNELSTRGKKWGSGEKAIAKHFGFE